MKKEADPWPSDLPRTAGNQYRYPEAFEKAWSTYPNRDGPNPKLAAYKAFRARIRKGDSPDELTTAARHYAEHCATTEKVGTEYVQQAATFWGAGEPFREFVEGSGVKRKPHWSELMDPDPRNKRAPPVVLPSAKPGWEADLQ